MPVTYHIDAAAGLIATRCSGEITFEEVKDHFESVGSEPLLPARLDVLLDLSALNTAPDSTQLRDAIYAMERLNARVQWGHCAVVVSNDLMYGMFRMFEAYSDELFQSSRVFRDRKEAEAWFAGGCKSAS
jgi:hypothetical protein